MTWNVRLRLTQKAMSEYKAAEFIETTELGTKIEDTATAMYEQVVKPSKKDAIIKELGSSEEYDKMVSSLLLLKT